MRVLAVTTAGSGSLGPLVLLAPAGRDSGYDVRVAALVSIRATVAQAGLPPIYPLDG